MKISIKCLIVLIAFSISAYCHAFELTPHKATYTAKIKKGISIDGKAVRELRSTGHGQWLYLFNVESFVADIKESVIIEWQDGRVIPQAYKYKLSPFLASNRKRNVYYDWKNKSASGKYKKRKWILKNIPLNTLDTLSYQLQLLMDINAQKKDVYYQVLKKGKISESHFQVKGEETISTKFGKLNSILVTKVRAKSKKRQTFMWFSKDYPMLLLKMTQVEKDGEKYEINIKKATINGKKISF